MSKQGTYYDILGLEENCSSEEIRNSFIKKSKQFHPDTNSDNPALHNEFVRIKEAYEVLSKKSTRDNYDAFLKSRRRLGMATSAKLYRKDWDHPVWNEVKSWPKTAEKVDWSKIDSYYGIKGIRRKPNSWILAGAFALMGIGMLFHYATFKYSVPFRLAQYQIRHNYLSNELRNVKERAKENGSDAQLEIFTEQMENSRKY